MIFSYQKIHFYLRWRVHQVPG